MNPSILTYIGSCLLLGWGVTHLFPTRSVVLGFGEISPVNKRIIALEWMTEGVALIFIALKFCPSIFSGASALIIIGAHLDQNDSKQRLRSRHSACTLGAHPPRLERP